MTALLSPHSNTASEIRVLPYVQGGWMMVSSTSTFDSMQDLLLRPPDTSGTSQSFSP